MPAPRRRDGARPRVPAAFPLAQHLTLRASAPVSPPESFCFHPPGDVAASSTEAGHTGVAGLRALEGRAHGRPRLLPGPSGAARHPRAPGASPGATVLRYGLGTPDFFVSLSSFSLGHSEVFGNRGDLVLSVRLSHPPAGVQDAWGRRWTIPEAPQSGILGVLPTPGPAAPGVPPPPRAPIPPPPAPTLASLNFSPRTPALRSFPPAGWGCS